MNFTRVEKVLWPANGFTKGQLLSYYRDVAPALLPHLQDRAVTLVRYPDGVEGPGWFQSNCRGQPEWVRTTAVTGRRGQPLQYCVVDDLRSLLWAVNLATIEFHPFLHTVDDPEHPRLLVFDLDPGEPASLIDCCRVALRLRDRLEPFGLQAQVKSSGQSGLHLLVPLAPEHPYERVKGFARTLAAELAEEFPDEIVDRSLKTARRGKVFIDWSQNSVGKSTVAPWSLRAVAFPLVSTPLQWEDVERACATQDEVSLVFSPDEALRLLDARGDLLTPALARGQRLPHA